MQLLVIDPFKEYFLIKYSSIQIDFLLWIYSVNEQSIVHGREYLKPESMNAMIPCCFPVSYFLHPARKVPGVFSPQAHLRVLKILFCFFFILSAFVLCHFYSHYLLQSCIAFFFFFASGCLLVLLHSPPSCVLNFISLFRLYCLSLSRYLSSISSFATIFWFISSNYIVRLVS